MYNRNTRIKIFSIAGAFLMLCLALLAAPPEPLTEGEIEELQKFAEYDKPEYRGLWITRFEWPSEDPEECRNNIIEVFDNMEKGNFNAAFFQLRGSASVYYPSDLEPWASQVGSKSPGFDPMQMAIEEAHKRGIEFHAYINPIPMCLTRDTPPPETDPEHIYYRHGPDTEEPWICMDEQGKPMNAGAAGYWYFSPGIPEVHEYLRTVIMDMVRRYDIDGVHLDRIRYPGSQYSHDPVSERRFQGRGNPNLEEWADWQREQLDKFVNDLYAEIAAEKPDVVVSCAAWGIYNRYHIEGYYNFSSGYHNYFQDTWNWIDIGAMDILCPMIYWDLADPKPNYNELIDDFVENVGGEHIIGGQKTYGDKWESTENINEILYGRKAGILGSLLFAYGSTKSRGLFERLPETIYSDEVETPMLEWKEKPETGIVLGKVVDENDRPVTDAEVSLIPEEGGRDIRRNSVFRHKWPSSADGRFAFLNIPPVPVTVRVEYLGAEPVMIEGVNIVPGEVRDVNVVVEGAAEATEQVFFEILSPEREYETGRETVHILGRTFPENSITVGGEKVEVFSTGSFARDNIPLEMGENRIEITAENPEGKKTTRYITVTRKEEEVSEPGVKSTKILQPSSDMIFMPGDSFEIRAQGPTGKKAYVTCWDKKIKLHEAVDENGEPTGDYSAVYRIPSGFSAEPDSVKLVFEDDGSFFGLGKVKIQTKSEAEVQVWDPSKVRVAESTADKTQITLGTHYVRLGGPYIAEVSQGTRFEVIGKHGNKYRIRLSESLTGWVNEKQVKMLPENTPVPQASFTYCIINGDEDYDALWIPIKENVVCSITPDIKPDNRLYIDFFNTFFATTWFSHKSGAKVIGAVSGEQIEDDRYRLTVPLKCKQNWGYWMERDENGITVYVKRPPELAEAPASPLKGLTIAIEAGHGGRNSGAVGHLGTKEKTINQNACQAIKKVLEEKGAIVVETRPGDAMLSLEKRVQNAIDGSADLYLSIHANAAGTARGFMRVFGTSTYYRHLNSRLVAEKVYDELLKLDWDEFGIVGNFHYYPLRETRFPSMLVEQAFMSHPGDEARLLDPEYQEKQAEAIVRGMENFLGEVRE